MTTNHGQQNDARRGPRATQATTTTVKKSEEEGRHLHSTALAALVLYINLTPLLELHHTSGACT